MGWFGKSMQSDIFGTDIELEDRAHGKKKGRKTKKEQTFDDCEGIPTGSNAAPSKTEPDSNSLSKQLAKAQEENEELKKRLATANEEIEALKLQLMKSGLKDGANLSQKYRTTGLPVHRPRRIASKKIMFKGQKRIAV